MKLALLLSDILLAQTDAGQGAADAAPAGPLAGLQGMLPFVLMFAVIYFLLVRPASKQRKEQSEMLAALKKDDEVVTTGGIWGRITTIDERVITLEIADKVKIRILRDRIAGRWNPDNPNPPKQTASASQ